jgi:predicted RNA binding protein YcfA (HicA-like mRNA interferase family)
MPYRTLARILRAQGCAEVRQSSSHVRWRCGTCSTTIPVHAGRDIAPGTLRSIERDLTPCLGEGWLTSMTTTFHAEAFRDETGTWCASVEALGANTQAASFLELRANLADAVEVSLDPPAGPFAVEIYVHTADLQAAVDELGRAS